MTYENKPPAYDITQTPRRASRYYQARTEKIPFDNPASRTYRRSFASVFVLGMLLIFAILTFWSLVVTPWYQGITNQWHYGDAKIFTLRADVGHGGISQFISFDSDGQITVVESLKGKVTVYTGGNFIGQDRLNRIITLSIEDVNHDGKPDIVIHIIGMESAIVLFNTGSAFSWTNK